MDRDLEKVHDEQIAPLMDEIIRICKENKLPMLATFQYRPREFCTTSMTFDGDQRLNTAFKLIMNGFTAFTISRAGQKIINQKKRPF